MNTVVTSPRRRFQYRLRTLLGVLTAFGVSFAFLHYLGPVTCVVLVLLFGTVLLFPFGIILIGTVVGAYVLERIGNERLAGFFIVTVPAIVGVVCLCHVHPGYWGAIQVAFTNCFVSAWIPVLVSCLVFFPVLVFIENWGLRFGEIRQRRLPSYVLVGWAGFAGFLFFLRYPVVRHGWSGWTQPMRLEHAATNLLVYLAGVIPIILLFRPWRLVPDAGLLGKTLVTLAVIVWGYLLASFQCMLILRYHGGIE